MALKKNKEKSRLKVNKITIGNSIEILKHFNPNSESRIYQIAPTENTTGYIMLCIDLPKEDKLTYHPEFNKEVQGEAVATESLN
jgi:hypothetical protein